MHCTQLLFNKEEKLLQSLGNIHSLFLNNSFSML